MAKKEYVYVLHSNGQPLMPTTRKAYVRKLLKSGRAEIVSYHPFTIQLKYVSTNIVQELNLSIDPGRTNLGFAVLSQSGACVYRVKVKTRNREIVRLLKERKAHRQASRSGERKRRQRRAIKNHTTFKLTSIKRILPKCEKSIAVNHIKNTEAKFCNRKRPDGWLTPTANHLLETHKNIVLDIQSFLPITKISMEFNIFDFARLENPNIKNEGYQNGRLKGYGCVELAVDAEQNNHCLFCQKPIEHYHHVVPVSEGGSETLENRVGLCEHHHDLVHKELKWQNKVKDKKEGLTKKYGGLSVLNQIMNRFVDWLSDTFSGEVYVCLGHQTKEVREKYNIEKDHDLDAYCIGLANTKNVIDVLYDIANTYEIEQFRRHNRQNIHRQTERTYKSNGKVIAKNRRKRIGQTEDSLHEWYIKTKATFGKKEAKRLQSQLKVLKSTRSYRNKDLVEPGSTVFYKGKRHVVSGNKNNGRYLLFRDTGSVYYKREDCKLLSYNKGLVYL